MSLCVGTCPTQVSGLRLRETPRLFRCAGAASDGARSPRPDGLTFGCSGHHRRGLRWISLTSFRELAGVPTPTCIDSRPRPPSGRSDSAGHRGRLLHRQQQRAHGRGTRAPGGRRRVRRRFQPGHGPVEPLRHDGAEADRHQLSSDRHLPLSAPPRTGTVRGADGRARRQRATGAPPVDLDTRSSGQSLILVIDSLLPEPGSPPGKVVWLRPVYGLPWGIAGALARRLRSRASARRWINERSYLSVACHKPLPIGMKTKSSAVETHLRRRKLRETRKGRRTGSRYSSRLRSAAALRCAGKDAAPIWVVWRYFE